MVSRFSRCCVRALPLFFAFHASGLFAQGTDLIRDYVGLIRVADHPGVIAFVDQIRAEQEAEVRRGGANNPRPGEAKKEAPYERPAGSGFLFRAEDGKTYILTNRHVTADAWSYSISFERSRGEKALYTGLSLVAADEEKDLALLAFAPGNSPEREGLLLLDRPVREGEEVFTAGFPVLGRETVWQFGRGQVSNSQVMLPRDYENEEFDGPFIQHTGQTDSGNSGGPLLIPNPQSPGGYAVAGINARSADRRQAANYAIPMETVREFLAGVFGPPAAAEAERAALDRRLAELIRRIRYDTRPGGFLSYRCFVENAEYAYYTSMEDRYIYLNPVQVIKIGLDELFAGSMPRKPGAAIKVLSVEAAEYLPQYEVIFQFKKKEVASTWILEDGKWRIASFGKLDGDKTRLVKAEKLYRYQWNIRDGEKQNYSFFLEGGYGYVLSRGPVFSGALGICSGGFYTDIGLRGFYADTEYWQVEIFPSFYSPHLRFGVLSVGLNVRPGVGFKKLPRVSGDDSGLRLGASFQAGFQITSSVIPGFYIGGAYQFNFYFRDSADQGSTRNLFIAAAGYRFRPWN